MVPMGQFADSSGKIDWEAYHKAQVDAGENCCRCGHWLLNLSGTPGRRQCPQCQKSGEQGEWSHRKYVRCPKCRNQWAPGEYEDYFDNTDIECPECECHFHIQVYVERTYTSPALGSLGEEED